MLLDDSIIRGRHSIAAASFRYRISILTMTPPAVLQIVNHRRFKQVDFSSVVLAGSGAAHLPPKLSRTFASVAKNIDAVSEGKHDL